MVWNKNQNFKIFHKNTEFLDISSWYIILAELMKIIIGAMWCSAWTCN